MSAAADQITGQWRQGGASLPLVLQKYPSHVLLPVFP